MIKESAEISHWLTKISRYNSKTIDLSLDRVKKIASKLNLIHFNCPVILVGGTNGKGTCVNLLDQIYRRGGYRVGISTSPHFHRINERLQINGNEVSDDELINAFQTMEIARENTPLTYFEFTTLAFLYILKNQSLDLIILEIGLGGRLDAMNVVEPDVSIITSIDLDHMDYLGNTREAIGREKAGIFRKDKPAICGDPAPPESVEIEAKRVGAVFYGRCDLMEIPDHIFDIASQIKKVRDDGNSNLICCIKKLLNDGVALKTIEVLQEKLPIKSSNIFIKNIKIPGRFEAIHKTCSVILDVAHNPAACKFLAAQLNEIKNTNKLYALTSILNDKDVAGCIEQLKDLVDEWHVTELKNERATKIDDLLNTITDISKRECYTHPSVSDGLANILKKAKESDICLVFGSFYTVAEARDYLL